MLKLVLIQDNYLLCEGAMNHPSPKSRRVWTVAEAKARLSEILRLAQEEGPHHIGRRKTFVVVPAGNWYARRSPRKPMGQWFLNNMPRGVNLDVSGKRWSRRKIPFTGADAE